MTTLALTKESILGYGHIGSDHRLHQLLERAITAKMGDKRKVSPAASGTIYWGLDHYGITEALPLLESFKLPEVHKELNNFTPTEATSIEKLGFAFNSKMMTLSETVEEKSLYANFAFDEMLHLRSLLNFVDFDVRDSGKYNPLLDALIEIVAEGDRLSTMFILQIALEGMGVAHYTWLANACMNPELKESFLTIVKDEAYHHGGGLILFPKTDLSPQTVDYIVRSLKKIVNVFYSWPQAYWLALEKGTGVLTEEQMHLVAGPEAFLEKARMKSSKFKDLIFQNAPANLALAIEKHGVFDDVGYEVAKREYLEKISPLIPR